MSFTGEYISIIQDEVLRNEARRFESTSLFLKELDNNIEKSIDSIKAQVRALRSRPEYWEDEGLQYRSKWNRELMQNIRKVRTDLANNVIISNSMQHFTDTYTKTYQNSVDSFGFGAMLTLPDKRAIAEAINYPWSGMMWSNRVWNNVNGITTQLQNEIIGALMTGDSYVNVAKRLDTSLIKSGQKIKYVTQRIVRTETARIRYIADDRFYKDIKLEKLEFCAIIDNRTSKVCKDNDGKIFELGKEPPIPLHPHCRSTYLPVVPKRTTEEWLSKIKEAKANDEAMVYELENNKKKEPPKDTKVKAKAYTEKATIKKDKNGDKYISVRNERYYMNKGDDKYIKQYNAIKSKEEFLKFYDSMKLAKYEGKLSDDFYGFMNEMEILHRKRDGIYAPEGYRYAITRGDIEALEKKMHSKGYFDRLTEKEINAMYIYSGGEYSDINGHLRGYAPTTNGYYLNDIIPNLTSGLHKGKLSADTVLFRGSDIDMFSDDFIDRLMSNPTSVEGETFKDKGFSSTSIYGGSAFDKNIAFQILAPKGTKGAYIKEYSQFKHENEFLLQKDTELKIVKVIPGRDDLHYTMVCEIVGIKK